MLRLDFSPKGLLVYLDFGGRFQKAVSAEQDPRMSIYSGLGLLLVPLRGDLLLFVAADFIRLICLAGRATRLWGWQCPSTPDQTEETSWREMWCRPSRFPDEESRETREKGWPRFYWPKVSITFWMESNEGVTCSLYLQMNLDQGDGEWRLYKLVWEYEKTWPIYY